MNFSAYAEQKEEISGMRLVSCGHIFAKPGREICRLKGREDWLLFYIAKENETFYLQKEILARAGAFILFAPGEKQHHIYTGTKTAEFYYVHFKCESLPSNFSLKTSQIYQLPFRRQVCTVFEEIIEETMQKAPCYEKLCLYKLLHLLTQFERDVIHENHPAKKNYERIALAVQHMNKYYDSNLELDDYAKMCNMSKYHFLRVFEQITGHTPLAYRNNIRLEHAAELLREEQLSIEEIQTMTGYSSASYFSSAFKQKFGVSPKKYQIQHNVSE